jgi:ferredoxin
MSESLSEQCASIHPLEAGLAGLYTPRLVSRIGYCEEFCNFCGRVCPTEAIRIFYKQISLRGGLPFPIEIPNELTASTLEKSRRGEDIQEFESLEAMFKDWEK